MNGWHTYQSWLEDEELDPELKRELQDIEGNREKIEERFSQELSFGTGGLRGIIGAGTNRMNRYTVRKVTQGLARYLVRQGAEAMLSGVVIAYDSRHQSPEFAREAALVLAANGVKAHVFDQLRPTPLLSFAVRHLRAAAGIMITASHNPPEYNGYKLYGADGAQITADLAEAVWQEIKSVSDGRKVRIVPLEEAMLQGLYVKLGTDVDEAYYSRVKTLALASIQDNADYKIVYTPLCGSGNVPVRRVLRELGFRQLRVVPEQEHPDGDFPTVTSPNPEDAAALRLAMEQAEREGADIVLATDPDADRLGVAVRDEHGSFVCLRGNELGALLLDYLLSARKRKGTLPHNGVIIKTIVTSEMGAAVAKMYGVDVVDTLTGFKYIAEKIKQFKKTGEKTFLFGYEESCGYLAGDFCRDKDAVQASLLTAEMGAYYKKQGVSLYEVLERLYASVGYFQEDLVSLTFAGLEGTGHMQAMMEELRKHPPASVGGVPVVSIKDYRPGLDGLPPADVVKFFLEDGSWFAARPSGTEPKMKWYFGVKGVSRHDSSARLEALKQEVMKWVR